MSASAKYAATYVKGIVPFFNRAVGSILRMKCIVRALPTLSNSSSRKVVSQLATVEGLRATHLDE